jgi:hypothetical protein
VGCLDVCLAPHGITGGEGVGTIGAIGTIGVGDQVPDGPKVPMALGSTGGTNRTLPSHGRGHRFNPCRAHQLNQTLT